MNNQTQQNQDQAPSNHQSPEDVAAEFAKRGVGAFERLVDRSNLAPLAIGVGAGMTVGAIAGGCGVKFLMPSPTNANILGGIAVGGFLGGGVGGAAGVGLDRLLARRASAPVKK